MANVFMWKIIRPSGGQVVHKHRLIDPAASKPLNPQTEWLSSPGRRKAGSMRVCSCSPLAGRGSASSAVRTRCNAASRSRRSSATSALPVSWIAFTWSANACRQASGSRGASRRIASSGRVSTRASLRRPDGSDRTRAWQGDRAAPEASRHGAGCRRRTSSLRAEAARPA